MTRRFGVVFLGLFLASATARGVAPAVEPGTSDQPHLVAVDSLVIDVLSDDVSDTYVSKTSFATSELANIAAAGADVVSGKTLCIANLGYGLRLRTRIADKEHVLLFDVGTEGHAFLHNCQALGVDLAEVEAIAITHGHWDHMGALPQALPVIAAKRGHGKVEVHVNPDMFVERGLRLATGTILPAEHVISVERMEALGAKVVSSRAPRSLLDGHFFYSGESPRVTSFEKGRVDHLARPAGGDWRPDPLLMDERMLVVHVKQLGLIVFSACSHAGIVNVCTEVRRLFPDVPIHAVLGGLHLGGVMERIIPETVEGLRPFDIRFLIPGHCTGWRALHALATTFGDRVSQSAIGTSYRFSAAFDTSPRAHLDK
jgi:7,8-dihydropterin-6-yl-methyl-4-(beta-D-ribofuranosyl)aminobenzene 5'-phosphate synthase